ncbi:class IIb bacteriocin, lactobin A/cerein 7B family [Reichenbachiella agariperforans]|uniref:Class IIb bacteriocin, lactobin A/cerein 7B family n=1 Tax=Reichenbachiella agariperforans TaxID=156994 RepID=A0A1M6RXN4_REIAG|nr:class IIb bacteriocin, lactobin A/cerein 7B family [Reichenbachiella agariperforans]SHK37059.1 class IIb bacteriocin, lactobin A/cerein 7B family [Reichenbachiella agariperforans]
MENLNELGLVEMRKTELNEVEGGWYQAALAITGAVIYHL